MRSTASWMRNTTPRGEREKRSSTRTSAGGSMRPNLNLITLGVEDLARSIAFYRDGLGWPPAEEAEDIVFFQLGGVALALYPRHLLAQDATVDSSGSGFPRFTLAHLTRNEREVDDALAQAERAGGQVVRVAQRTFWGGYSGYVADPDGFLWEIAHNPAWTLDDEGNVRLG